MSYDEFFGDAEMTYGDFCTEAGPFRLTHRGQRPTVVDTRAEVMGILRAFPKELHHEVTVNQFDGPIVRGDEAFRLWARCGEGET